jgi:hypothetical protein
MCQETPVRLGRVKSSNPHPAPTTIKLLQLSTHRTCRLSYLRGYSPAEADLTRRNRRWFVRFLSLAFLFAQFGMVVHASSHLRIDPHAAPAASQLCGECLSFAPLQSMVGGGSSAILFIADSPEHAVESGAPSFVPHRAFAAYRSRAPPQFL